METTSVCSGGIVLKIGTTYSLSVVLLEDFGDLSWNFAFLILYIDEKNKLQGE